MKPCIAEIYSEECATLTGDMRGHEHFGWRDGLSQPGVRGVVSSEKTADNRLDVVTPRQNPNDSEQGQPGQHCLYPGEFVYGYSCQNSSDVDEPGPFENGGLDIFDDGSLVVVRRLRQDVRMFQDTLNTKAQLDNIDASVLGAKLVEMFKDGSPIVVDDTPTHPNIGTDDALVN